MDEDTREHDAATDKSAESGSTHSSRKQQRDSARKLPPHDQHTPGEEGEKRGGGLQGA